MSGLNTFDGPWATERRNAVIDPWFLRRLLAGWRPSVVAEACGVSTRTAQRWRQQLTAIETVRVAGWEADFALRRSYPPCRVSLWRRV